VWQVASQYKNIPSRAQVVRAVSTYFALALVNTKHRQNATEGNSDFSPLTYSLKYILASGSVPIILLLIQNLHRRELLVVQHAPHPPQLYLNRRMPLPQKKLRSAAYVFHSLFLSVSLPLLHQKVAPPLKKTRTKAASKPVSKPATKGKAAQAAGKDVFSIESVLSTLRYMLSAHVDVYPILILLCSWLE
jgi:hypothetical protein